MELMLMKTPAGALVPVDRETARAHIAAIRSSLQEVRA